MFKLFLLSVISVFLFAQNPSIYALLGDVIYNNANEIKELTKVSSFENEKKDIEDYIDKTEQVKQIGFLIDSGDGNYSNREYLKDLRELSKENDKFVRLVNSKFIDAIDNNDTSTFVQLIDLDIVQKEKSIEKVKSFIRAHEGDVNSTEYYLQYKDALQTEKIEQNKAQKTSNNEKMSQIERIREKDKKRQKALQEELEKMMKDKKKQIYKQQKDALENY